MRVSEACWCAVILFMLTARLDACNKCSSSADKSGQCPNYIRIVGSKTCCCDKDCPGEQKCCVIKGDKHCVAPASSKPGVCPRLAALGPCLSQCSHDDECHGILKCCSISCSHFCLTPSPDSDLSIEPRLLP